MNYIKVSNPKGYLIADELNHKLIGYYYNKNVAEMVLKALNNTFDNKIKYQIYYDNDDQLCNRSDIHEDKNKSLQAN